MRLGIARAETTPQVGLRLSGFLSRSESVLDELEMRAFWLEDGANTACIITLDVIGVDADLTASLQKAISERCGIPPSSVFLSPSHTHSAPATCLNINMCGGPPDAGYISQLIQTAITLASWAKRDVHPVTLSVGRTSFSGFALRRRLVTDGKAVYGPSQVGTLDNEVTTLVFRDAQSKDVCGVLFHYTCHPTVMCDSRITSDYPGSARRFVEKTLSSGVAVGYLPGCFGDIRPNCTIVGGGTFRKGTPDDLNAFGDALGAKVLQAIEAAVPAGKDRLGIRNRTIQVPLANGYSSIPLELTHLDLAEDVALVGMGADVCVDFGLFIKAQRPGKTTIPVSYVNGAVAYLCPERYFAEGGYEPAVSWRSFGLPGPLSPKTEEVVTQALKTLIHAPGELHVKRNAS